MATVPVYGEQKVERQALPGVRIQPASNVDEAFGGGASSAAVGSANRELGNTLQQIAAQHQRNADDLAVQDADLKAGILATKLEVDTKRMQGKDALGAPDLIGKEWENGTQEIIKGLGNDNQRAMLQKRLNARYLSLNESTQMHVAGQMQKYDETTTNAYMANAQNEAVSNYLKPERISLSIFQQQQTFFQFAKRNGLPDEALKLGMSKIKNDTHTAVLTRMLADNNVDLASQYYGEHKGELTGDDATRLAGFIDKATILQQAETKASEIMEAAKTPEDALAAVNKITDKEMRAAVRQECEAKVNQQTLALNQIEGGVGSNIATGKYKNISDLEADRQNVTPEFYNVAAESFSVKFDSISSKTEKQKKYLGLVERFGGLSDTDVYKKTKNYADFRKDVLASKAWLKPKEFQKLLGWTDPNFVEQIEPKKGFIKAGIEFINSFYRRTRGVGPSDVVEAISRFMDKSTDPKTAPENVSAVAREILRDASYAGNPSMMNLAEPTNYVHTTDGGVNVAYPAKSDAKSDTTETEEMVNVVRRSDGQKGKIPRSKFSNEKYKLA